LSAPSIARSVIRTHVLSFVVASIALVVVGSSIAGAILVREDDVSASALARTLGSELHNHASDSRAQLDQLIEHELEEERWFERRTEVWRNQDRIGGSVDNGVLGSAAHRPPGCSCEKLEGSWHRICAVVVDPPTTIVVASPLLPLLRALAPLVGAIATIMLFASLGFSLASRKLMQRSLTPLIRFEQKLSTLSAFGREPLATTWGALEVDALASTFNALLVRIDTAIEREQRFVADAAHELRTPLTRLRGQIELVLGQLDADSESSQRLSLAVRTCEELARMTDALLAMARNEASVDETLDLADIARGLERRLAPEQLARLDFQLEEEVLVRGDEALLALAASNLIDNALKYTEGSVRVRVFQANDLRAIEVVDSGTGISAEDMQLVRQPFVRGSARGTRARGAGLGLALVEQVAVLHTGQLLLENLAPQGLRAQLSLPAWRPRSMDPVR